MATPPAEKRSQDPVHAKTVNFSDLEKEKALSEDQASCEDKTLPWDNVESASLSDDAKLATTTAGSEPSEQETRLSLTGSRDFYVSPCSTEKPLHDDGMIQAVSAPNGEVDNQMPEVAKQAFVSHVQVALGNHVHPQTQCSVDSRRRSEMVVELCEWESRGNESCDHEKQAFLAQDGPRSSKHKPFNRPMEEWSEEGEAPYRPGCCKNCTSSSLKNIASFLGAVVIFPCLLYGAYVFLPFDVPLMPGISTRLIYTLRCGVFATFPIVIGLIVYGISHLCFPSADNPFCCPGERPKREREVERHQHFVTQSVHLFVLYFFNLAVLATYLPQETLKLVPLLMGFFSLARLIYWLSYVMGRAFRGFGYGLTFIPLLAMLVCNLLFIFLVEPDKMFAVEGSDASRVDTHDPAPKVRLWG